MTDLQDQCSVFPPNGPAYNGITSLRLVSGAILPPSLVARRLTRSGERTSARPRQTPTAPILILAFLLITPSPEGEQRTPPAVSLCLCIADSLWQLPRSCALWRASHQPADGTRATSPSDALVVPSPAPLTIMPPGHDTTAHRSKRPFQPSITSFFARHDHADAPEGDDERGPSSASAPKRPHQHQHQQQHQHQHQQLPASVQADLLGVGMRVRKSVPEGYKTHKTASLPSLQTTRLRSPNGSSTATTTEYTVKPPRDAVPAHVQHQRELLPFCGLQKIGGYAEQPVTNVHLYSGSDSAGERPLNIFPLPAEAFTQPFSSSSSTDSSISSSSLRPHPNPANLHKRSWQDESDTPLNVNSDSFFKIPMKVAEDDVPISPMSATPPQGIAFPPAPLRPFAQPKTRRSGMGRAMDVDNLILKETDLDMDLENAEQQQAEGRVLVGSPGDFEEAEFLRSWGPGREVDMGGI